MIALCSLFRELKSLQCGQSAVEQLPGREDTPWPACYGWPLSGALWVRPSLCWGSTALTAAPLTAQSCTGEKKSWRRLYIGQKISCYKHKHSIFTGYLSNWNIAFSATQSLPPVQASSYWKRKVPGTFSKLNIAKPCIHNTRGFWGIAWTQKKWSQL